VLQVKTKYNKSTVTTCTDVKSTVGQPKKEMRNMVKHYDGKMIRFEQLDKDEMPVSDKDEDIQIKYKEMVFTFFPQIIVKNESDKPIFAFKINTGEKLSLYWRAEKAKKILIK
jgi:hypothetical protein